MDKQGKKQFFSALGMAWELGYTIAIPLVIFALLGSFLDKKLGSSPFLLLTGVLISIVISTIGIYWKASKIMGKIAQDNKNIKKEKDKE